MTTLPTGWTEVALGDVTTSRLGKMLSKAAKSGGAEQPYLGNADVRWGSLRLDGLRTMEFSEAEEREFELKAGDVLICEGGEVGRCAVVHHDLPGVYFQKALHRVRCSDHLDPYFLFRYMRFAAATGRLDDYSSQATIKHLTGVKLRTLRLPLPPLEEQRRIAAILDKADELRAKRRAALEQLDSLTRSIFIDMFGDPLENPKAFEGTELGAVSEFVRGVTFKPADVAEPGAAGAIRCMRTTNVQSQLETNDVIWIPREFVRRDEQMLLEGDTLISSANSWNLVGKACWVGDLDGAATFGGFVTVLRSASDRLDPWFLSCWFRSNRVQATVRSFGQRTTNISNLNLTRCRGLRIPLPPLAQQNEFRRRSRAVERQAAAAQRCEREFLALFASLQSRAFRGEL